MLNRYFSGTVPKPEERLLAEIQEIGDNYAALLTCIQKYPVDVIRQCCDAEGNTVLHMVLMKHNMSKNDAGASNAASSTPGDESSHTACSPLPSTTNTTKRRWSWGNADVDPVTNIEQDLPKLLHYLIHSVYPEIDQEDQFEEHVPVDDADFLLPRPATHYNSLVRLQAQETGRLPLHTACASRHAVPLPTLAYIVAAFPKAVQSPDLDGNLPLHAAAQHTAPLEALKFLVQLYPEAVKTPNEEGNLPLHLAAAAETYKQDCPTENNSNNNSGVAARRPSVLAASFVPMKERRALSNDESISNCLRSCGPMVKPRRRASNEECGGDTMMNNSNSNTPSIASPRRGVRRLPSVLKAPMMMHAESPTRRSVRRTPSFSANVVRRMPSSMMAPLQRNESSSTTNGDDGSFCSMSGAFTFDVATPQASNSCCPPRGKLMRNASTSSHGSMMSTGSGSVINSPVRGVARKITTNSNGSMMSVGSSTLTNSPVRGVSRKNTINSPVRGLMRRKSSSAPPMAAFQRKPLSKAAIDQRDVVKFLVECWPESVYETNHAGQTAEQMATASAVTLHLQECTATSTDDSNSNNPAGLEVGIPSSTSFAAHHQRNSNFKVMPISKERARSSFRVSSSSSLGSSPSNLKNKIRPTAPQRKSSNSSHASFVEETSQEFTTVIG